MTLISALLLFLQQTPKPPDVATSCQYDRKMLDLGYDAFDQDSQNGWRTLSTRPGCEAAAAAMIRAYRMNYQEHIPVLLWHEAQLLAVSGDYAAAVPLMERSTKSADRDIFGWNAYADATIAFLRNDKKALIEARTQLAKLSKPDNVPAAQPWPPNLHIVDALIRCFGQPYRIAYGPSCQTPRP